MIVVFGSVAIALPTPGTNLAKAAATHIRSPSDDDGRQVSEIQLKYCSILHTIPSMSHFEKSPPDARLLEPRDVLDGGKMGAVDERVAALMAALSSPTRIRALFALLEAGELATGDLAKSVGMSDSATSHQLRVLRDLGLVERRREGRQAFYSLADAHLAVLLKEALYHVDHGRIIEEGQA